MAQKRDIAVCASKIQLLSKTVCYKVSLCENSTKAAWCLWRVSMVFTRSAISPPEVIYLVIYLVWPHQYELVQPMG